MSGFGDGEEEYRGTVTVVLPGGNDGDRPPGTDGGASGNAGGADTAGASDAVDTAVEVGAHLAGRFSPLTGDYRWRGRLSAHEEITAAFERGVRTVLVRTPGGFEGTGVLDGPNLWGGHPVRGTGAPPFAVPEVEIGD